MKINRGNMAKIQTVLRIENRYGVLEIKEGDRIKVITDTTDFDKEYNGSFEYVDNEHICINGENIPINYIEEIFLDD